MRLPMLTIVDNNRFRAVAGGRSWRGRAGTTLACIVLLTLASSAFLFAQDTSAKAEIQAGILAYKFSNYQRAVEHFQTALKLDPASTEARLYSAEPPSAPHKPPGDIAT